MRVQFSIALCLALAMLSVAMAEEESVLEEQNIDFIDDDESADEAKPLVPLKKNSFTGRTWDWAKKMAKWMGYDYEDYEEEYYDYYYPVPQYEGHQPVGHHALQPVATSGHGGSSYVSYQQHPAQFHHSPARDDYVTDDDDWGFMDMIFDIGVVVAPIGLLLAAIPSGLFTFAVRRRSFGDNSILEDTFDADELPILRDLLENDLFAFTTQECQMRLFCEIAQLGEKEESSLLQKGFFYASALTPDFVARKAGLDDLFRYSRYGQCEILKCGPSLPDAFAPVSNDLDSPSSNETEADLTEPIKQ